MTADTPTNDPLATVLRLQRATNDHDLAALTACFAEDYVNETPVHPTRGFTGRAQVRRNWGRILAAVPDLRSTMVSSVVSAKCRAFASLWPICLRMRAWRQLTRPSISSGTKPNSG